MREVARQSAQPGRETYPVETGRTTSTWGLFCLLGPALSIILMLFGGGLILGLLQALGHLPSESFSTLTLKHFNNILQDPDFGKSLLLTLHISLTSTLIAAVLSVALSLGLMKWAEGNRLINFMLQIPLTVPHLVLAVSITLLLTPSGLLSRLLSSLSLISTPGEFPLLINDQWGFGILVVYIWKEVPFITFMLLAVLKNMGPELLEVGASLNASKYQRFTSIILPTIGPNLAGACLIVFAFTFGAFEVPYLLGRSYPLALPVWAYKNYSDIDLLARPEGIGIGLLIAVIIICSIVLSHILLHINSKRGLMT